MHPIPYIERVIIYGSRAKGNLRPGSNIDLTMEGEHLNLSEQMEIEDRLDDLLLPYKIDLSIKQHIRNKDLIGHIDGVGKVFYLKS
ncbi:nucleotidyltransferase domain-containing protein [Negadavirga shengliensis]|uniref:Nucleotidyltransferase domain-containing protein n=1 Tax=Negadavirga shengliensis TaxID=1389218 RepID=A0ABV9SW09_9BACT